LIPSIAYISETGMQKRKVTVLQKTAITLRVFRISATSHLEVKENLNTRKLRKSGIATFPSAFLPRFIFLRAAIATWPRLEVVRFFGVRYLQFSIKLINLPVERLIKFMKLDFSKSCHETRLLFRPYSGSSVINGWRN